MIRIRIVENKFALFAITQEKIGTTTKILTLPRKLRDGFVWFLVVFLKKSTNFLRNYLVIKAAMLTKTSASIS